MSTSGAFKENTQATPAIEDWYKDSIQCNAYLDEVFKHEFPEWWNKLTAAQKAGKWTKYEIGPHNTKAIIYKKHSTDHIDEGDIGPTMLHVLPTQQHGGYLELVDLETRLYYCPGSIVIGFFGLLWHFVTEVTHRNIEAPQKYKDSKLTPGRVTVVSYFPKTSFNQLYDKPPGWARETMWGREIVSGEC